MEKHRFVHLIAYFPNLHREEKSLQRLPLKSKMVGLLQSVPRTLYIFAITLRTSSDSSGSSHHPISNKSILDKHSWFLPQQRKDPEVRVWSYGSLFARSCFDRNLQVNNN